MLSGIDVSEFQGEVDWPSLNVHGHDVKFVYARATYGTTGVDSSFRRNWEGIKQRRLLRGPYHYTYPPGVRGGPSSAGVRTGALAEAEHFIAAVEAVGGLQDGDLPPMLDLEEPKTGLSSELRYEFVGVWVQEVERRLGRKPIIYTGFIWREFLNQYTHAWGCPLWTADYGVKEPWVGAAWQKTGWLLWQYSDAGTAEGIRGPVDLDVFRGTEAELEALAHGHGHHAAPHHEGGPHHHGEPAEHHHHGEPAEHHHHGEPAEHHHAPSAPLPVPHQGHAPSQPRAPLAHWPGRVLSEGVSGEDVRLWQHHMRDVRGFSRLVVDGKFGRQATEACRWLQLYLRRPPTGEVDEALWHATWDAP